MSKSMMMYVVDDAADYRFLVEQVFELFLPQYRVQLFVDGLELIQHMEQPIAILNKSDQGGSEGVLSGLVWPDLIVLDIDMPRLNGLQTLEQLKQNSQWKKIPVVMMSNRSDPGFQTAASALGANSYFTKPMDMPRLQEVIGQLCHQWLN